MFALKRPRLVVDVRVVVETSFRREILHTQRLAALDTPAAVLLADDEEVVG